MEGFSFYWIFWLFWILVTFFMKKTSKRTILAVWILTVISLSATPFSVGGITISFAAIFILLTAHFVILLEEKKQLLYSFLIVYIVMLAVAGFQLMELYDPVWVMFDRKWMMAAFLIYIILMLEKDIRLQLAVMISGVIFGDLLFGIMIRKIALYHVGSPATLDVVAVTMAVLLCIHGLKESSMIFEEYFKQQEREKEKTP